MTPVLTRPVGIESIPSPLIDSDLRDATKALGNVLGERHWTALGRIKSLLRAMGLAWCDERAREAVVAHAAGTCLRADGQSRSLGGCFFRLAFEALPPEQRIQIFGRDHYNIPRATGPMEVKAATPKTPVVTEWNGEMSTAKLEVILKLNELPRGAFTLPGGHKQFYLDCSGRTVTVTLRPKLWTKLETAARDWPQWVGTVTGQMGPATPKGFELLEPGVQVFERKAKTP